MRVKREQKVEKKPEKKDVRHGCVDCSYYDYPVTKQPCKGCEKYSNWVDKRVFNNA